MIIGSFPFRLFSLIHMSIIFGSSICLNETDLRILAKDTYNGPAELALWTIIILIVFPIILTMIVILICCNYICFWCRPYPNRGPGLIIDRGCSRNSNNYNAF